MSPVVAGYSMTNDDVGAPARLSGRPPSAATNIPLVHTLLMAIQPTCPRSLKKGMRRMGGLQLSVLSKNRPNCMQTDLVTICSLCSVSPTFFVLHFFYLLLSYYMYLAFCCCCCYCICFLFTYFRLYTGGRAGD